MPYVIGTAGHIDHGKSVLVKALTGIDPDRLKEEKERGMTIDLGFAWLTLPSGRDISIVDVPGHERFIKNMLAGVGGIDLALLIIAADESVMPQTREHLAILDLLRVDNGIAVITKSDLVDGDLLELVTMEAEEVLAGTTLTEAPIVPVSAVTGHNIPELLSTIDAMLDKTPPKRDIGRPRLPIDRIFTIAGFGTVVTGTLIDGTLKKGQEVEIVPAGIRTYIRGLQSHKQNVDIIEPGSRVAANLANISTEQLSRGDVITSAGWLKPTGAVDVRLKLLGAAPRKLAHNTTVSFHTGAAESQAKLRLLDAEEIAPGETALAQLALDTPVAALKDDLFIIRSTMETLGGGQILATHAKRHRRFHAATIERLEASEAEAAEDVILATLDPQRPIEMSKLISMCSITADEVGEGVESLERDGSLVSLGERGDRLIFAASAWESLARSARSALEDYHRRNPLRQGMPKEELKDKLKLTAKYFPKALERLASDGVLCDAGLLIRLPSHDVKLTPEQQRKIDAYMKALASEPYSPPAELTIEPELLGVIVGQGKAVKVAENVLFAADAYDEMVRTIVQHIKSNGQVTVAEVRDMLNTSRKYALALMEYLDSQKITRRVGDGRVLR